ncbi:carbohydrate ABC transporter permease [Sediminispirochaeta bajacaliforniensis]|uniref:carbohydrate ABC transporter permease n=1 Tax=Sediminispirochaeta bajacaliforniensis TaxID=148 RepID=UPI00036E87A0|nr:carbohydrate ABC transporter permease [Sediminispirochaeta bajacaliforniensis]
MAVAGYTNGTKYTLWTLRTLVVICLVIFFMLPVVWILTTSLAQRIAMFKLPPQLFSKPTWKNFSYIFTQMPVLTWTLNSLIISLGTMVLSLIIGVPAGYAFSRVNFTGKRLLLIVILLTRALPTIVIVLPFRVIMQSIGVLGTRFAVVLIDTVYNAAFTFWLMSGIFESIPEDLEEAARIDGCTPIQAFLLVAVPLSKPGLVTSALFAFIFSWNDFLFALTLTSPDTATLPLGMLSTYGVLQQGWTYMAAMGVVAIIPVVTLSLFLQRYYVSGLTFGGVK